MFQGTSICQILIHNVIYLLNCLHCTSPGTNSYTMYQLVFNPDINTVYISQNGMTNICSSQSPLCEAHTSNSQSYRVSNTIALKLQSLKSVYMHYITKDKSINLLKSMSIRLYLVNDCTHVFQPWAMRKKCSQLLRMLLTPPVSVSHILKQNKHIMFSN